MNKFLTVIIIVVFTAFGIGCSNFQSTTQLEEGTYLQISGKPGRETLILDSSNPIILDDDTKSFNFNGQTLTKIKIRPGNHTVLIERAGKTIIHRNFYVSEGNIFEVNIR